LKHGDSSNIIYLKYNTIF